MKLRDAEALASQLLLSLDRYCIRVAVGGSIRREVPECKDIELVAIPRNRYGVLNEWAPAVGVQWIKTGTPDVVPWQPQLDGKYWRGLLREQVKLDLFLTTHGQWGLLFLIRTGSAEFSEAVVTHGKRIGRRVQGGYLRAGTTEASPIIPTPEERDVFRELGLAWVDPPARTGPEALRLRKELARSRA